MKEYVNKRSGCVRCSILLVCTWRHGGHVGGQEQKHFSPLGTKLHFHVNYSRKSSIVLTPNMAALSRGCKPRIVASICVSVWSESVVAEGHYYLQTSIKCCHVNIQGTHYSCNYMYLQCTTRCNFSHLVKNLYTRGTSAQWIQPISERSTEQARGGGGYFKTFGVGMCLWDPGIPSLYQS